MVKYFCKHSTPLLIIPVVLAQGLNNQWLYFNLTVEGTTVLSVNFLDTVGATLFFEDNLINLGTWSDYISADNILDVNFNLDVRTNGLDSRFYTDILLGDSTMLSGDTNVPLPAAGWLFISAYGIIRFFISSERLIGLA